MALVPILNSATYVESSLSTYGFGAVAEAVPMLCLRRPGGRPGNCSDAPPWAAWPGEAQPAEERTPRAYCAEIAFRLEGMSPVSRLKAREK